MTHLLELLDLTTNTAFKKLEKKAFSDNFTEIITKELLRDPECNVTTINIDLKLSILKPLHASKTHGRNLFIFQTTKRD